MVLFHFFAKEKTKIGITDHISIVRFCLWIRKKDNDGKLPFPIFHYEIEKKNEIRKGGIYTDPNGEFIAETRGGNQLQSL